MADLNALIAQGTQFQAPVNPFVQYGQMQQLQQNEQANELARYTMAKARQEDVTRNALNQAYQTNLNPETGEVNYPGLYKSLAGANAGASIPGIQKTQFETQTARTEGQIKDTKLLAEKLALLPEAYRLADTPEAYLTLHQSVHADPVLGPYLKSLGATPEKGMATLQNAVQTGKFNDLRMGSMQSVSQLLDSMKTQPDAALMKQLGYQQTPAGYEAFRQAQRAEPRERLLTPQEEAQKTRIALASRPPAQPRAEQPPVAVMGPNGTPIFVSREQAMGMTPANIAEKPMTALQKQAFKKDFANDTSKVKSATDTANELEKLTDELVGNPDKGLPAHPGLGGITGYAGLLPSFAESPLSSGNAAKAEQKLETFKGKIKALGRAIASQEGKLGNMAVQEWQMVSDAVQSIKPTAGNLDVQMRDVVRQARDLARNMKDKFDLTYEGTAPTAAPATGGNVVVTPDGQSHTFPTPAAAAQFKKAAGIQ